MELIFILTMCSVALSLIMLVNSALDESIFYTYISCVLLLISIFNTINIANLQKESKTIVIEKSSDSDWEISTEKIERDTCITRIVVFNDIDTVYPTTCYKVLKIN